MNTELHRTALRGWVGLLLTVLAGPALGTVSISPIADVNLGPWDPSQGSLTRASIFCVQSIQGPADRLRDYRMRVAPLTSAIFELVSTTDPTQRIPFQLHFDDLSTPSSEQLVEDSWSTRDKDGAVSCAPPDLNAQVRAEFAALDLGQVAAGFYQASFTFRAGSVGTDEDTFLIGLTIGEAVWIQSLDPIPLTYTMGSDAVGDEPFCVWSSTGAYDITISSQTPTASTTFVAIGQAVPANTVSYSVLFDSDADASDGATVTEAATIINQLTTATGTPASCSSDNAAIRVNFSEAGNLDSAPSDTYQDELILFVEPR